MPVLFLGYGSPMNAIENNVTGPIAETSVKIGKGAEQRIA